MKFVNVASPVWIGKRQKSTPAHTVRDLRDCSLILFSLERSEQPGT